MVMCFNCSSLWLCVLIVYGHHCAIISYKCSSSYLYCSISISNSIVAYKYAPLRKVSMLMSSMYEEEDDEDKRKGKTQKADTHWNQRAHIPCVTLTQVGGCAPLHLASSLQTKTQVLAI